MRAGALWNRAENERLSSFYRENPGLLWIHRNQGSIEKYLQGESACLESTIHGTIHRGLVRGSHDLILDRNLGSFFTLMPWSWHEQRFR